MKTEESNKIIAEFMGMVFYPKTSIHFPKGTFEDREGIGHCAEKGTPYNSSWDWLMPVVEKIEQEHQGVPQQMLYVNLYSRLEEVYEAVVEFIIWYNQNKK